MHGFFITLLTADITTMEVAYAEMRVACWNAMSAPKACRCILAAYIYIYVRTCILSIYYVLNTKYINTVIILYTIVILFKINRYIFNI